jgi:hypothetical protein
MKIASERLPLSRVAGNRSLLPAPDRVPSRFREASSVGDPPPTEIELDLNDPTVVAMRERLRENGLAHGLLSDKTVERALEDARPL